MAARLRVVRVLVARDHALELLGRLHAPSGFVNRAAKVVREDGGVTVDRVHRDLCTRVENQIVDDVYNPSDPISHAVLDTALDQLNRVAQRPDRENT